MQERSAGLKEQILENGGMLPYSLLSVLKWVSNVQSLVMGPNSWWTTLSQSSCLVFRIWGTCKQRQLPATERLGQLWSPRVLAVGWSKRSAWRARRLLNLQVSQSLQILHWYCPKDHSQCACPHPVLTSPWQEEDMLHLGESPMCQSDPTSCRIHLKYLCEKGQGS